MKWVIADANTRYEVGNFDGKSWKGFGDKDSHGKSLKFDFGDSYYAAQTFNQAPKNRVVHIGWLRSKNFYHPFLEANMPFAQQMSIPAEITLRTTPEGIRMFGNPVAEIETLYAKTHNFKNLTAEEANSKLSQLTPELIDMTVSFIPEGDLTLSVRGLPTKYSKSKNQLEFVNSQWAKGL